MVIHLAHLAITMEERLVSQIKHVTKIESLMFNI